LFLYREIDSMNAVVVCLTGETEELASFSLHKEAESAERHLSLRSFARGESKAMFSVRDDDPS